MSSTGEIGSTAWERKIVIRESWKTYQQEILETEGVKPFHPFQSIEVFYRSMVTVQPDPKTGTEKLVIVPECHPEQIITYTQSSSIHGDMDSLFCFTTEFHTAHYFTTNSGEPLLTDLERDLLVYHWTLAHTLEETARHLSISLFEAKCAKNYALIKIRDFVFWDADKPTWDIAANIIRPAKLYAPKKQQNMLATGTDGITRRKLGRPRKMQPARKSQHSHWNTGTNQTLAS